MTYIKKEDVIKNIKWHNADWILEHLIEDINSLPSIDPKVMIEEMIEIQKDKLNDLNPSFEVKLIRARKLILEKLLKKFKS